MTVLREKMRVDHIVFAARRMLTAFGLIGQVEMIGDKAEKTISVIITDWPLPQKITPMMKTYLHASIVSWIRAIKVLNPRVIILIQWISENHPTYLEPLK